MSDCLGTKTDHCCWVDGAVCPHFEEDTVAGRSIACGLFRQLGSWTAVHASVEYQRDVQPMYDRMAGRITAPSCGDWPGNRKICATCNIRGDNKDLDQVTPRG